MVRAIVARAIVAVLLGIAVGYAFGKSSAHDVALGRQLTLKEYVADYEHHKQALVEADYPLPVAIVSGVIMVLVVFGVYELLVLAVDRLIAALDRRRGFIEPGADVATR